LDLANVLERVGGWAYAINVKTLSAHFDGKNIVLDEPAILAPNTKVTVIVAEQSEINDQLVRATARLSEPVFQRIWDNPLDAEYDKL
jgi:hypothetical protein